MYPAFGWDGNPLWEAGGVRESPLEGEKVGEIRVPVPRPGAFPGLIFAIEAWGHFYQMVGPKISSSSAIPYGRGGGLRLIETGLRMEVIR